MLRILESLGIEHGMPKKKRDCKIGLNYYRQNNVSLYLEKKLLELKIDYRIKKIFDFMYR